MRRWIAIAMVLACRSPADGTIDADAVGVVDGQAPDGPVDGQTPDAPVDAAPTDAVAIDAEPDAAAADAAVDAVVDAPSVDAVPIDAPPLPPPLGTASTRPLVYGSPGLRIVWLDAAGVVHLVGSYPYARRHLDVSLAANLPAGAVEVFLLPPCDPAEAAVQSLSLLIRFPDGSLRRAVEENGAWRSVAVPTPVAVTASIAAFSVWNGAQVIVYRGADDALHRLVRVLGAPAFVDHVVPGAVLPVGPISGGYGGAGLYAGADQRPIAIRVEADGTVTFRATFASAMVGRGAAMFSTSNDAALWHDSSGRLFIGAAATGVFQEHVTPAAVAGDLSTTSQYCAVYRSAAAHVMQVCPTGSSTSPWGVGDLTIGTSAPLAASDPTGDWENGWFMTVAFFATDGHLHTLTHVSKPPPGGVDYWTDDDLTAELSP